LKYLNCILRAQRWVHRRVDRVALVDSDVLVQNTSLDLTPPVEPPTFFLDAYPDAMVILPVMQITKRPLVHFDLRNEGNESVPLLTARQSRTLATLGMLVLADRVLEEAYQEGCLSYNVPGDDGEAADDGYSLNEDVRVDLDLENRPLARAALAPEAARAYRFVQQRIVDLVAEDADTGNAALDWFEYTSRGRNVEPGLEAEMAVLLWGSDPFRIYLRRLAGHYYLSPVLPLATESGNRRRILKVQFERPARGGHLGNRTPTREIGIKSWSVNVGLQILRDFLERFGMVPISVVYEAHQAVDCESYHVEFTAPTGLKIVDLDWFLSPLTNSDGKISSAEAQILKDLGKHPVAATPDIRRDNVEPARVNSTIHPIPLFYGLHVRWRLAASALAWISVAVPVAAAAVVLHAALALGTVQAGSLPDWVPNSIRADAGWALAATTPTECGAAPLENCRAADSTGIATGGSSFDALAQNRAALILGVIAVAVALLARTGEPPVTRRLLLFPRLSTGAIMLFLVVAAAPLWMTSHDLLTSAAPIVHVAPKLLVVSCILLLALFVTWGSAIGCVRRPRRYLRDKKSRYNEYWSAAQEFSATQFEKLHKSPGRLVRFFRIFSPSREPGGSLSDFTREKVFRSARIVAGSIEGPRFVPGDAYSSEDVIKKMDRLVRAEPRL